MSTSVTSHSSSAHVARIGTLTSLAMSRDSSSLSPNTSTSSLPSSPVSVTAMSGLLSSRNLVQDEKLVVATLATLNSGSASSLIKQDLKWIIQSRRKAEGKAELQVEFKKPVKDELTSEELMKRARRRELNRLAARRSREKGQKRKDLLVEEIRKLQTENSELVSLLGDLTEERNNIVLILRQHMKQCSDYSATQNAAIGVSQKVLDLLGFPSLFVSETQVQDVSDLYIHTGDSCSSQSRSQSPSIIVKQEQSGSSSCPTSPFLAAVGSQLIQDTSCPTSPFLAAVGSQLIQDTSCPTSPFLAAVGSQLIQDTSCPTSPFMAAVGSQIIKDKDTSMPDASIIYDDSSAFAKHSIFNLKSPQAGYSCPLGSLKFDSPPAACASPRLAPAHSYPQGLEAASAVCNSFTDATEEGEVIQYKHKLMKHRKHFYHASQSSFAGSRGHRASLERSFSFPCTVRESRSNFSSPSGSGSCMQEPYQPEILGFPENPAATPALVTGRKDDAVGRPLDLVLRKSPAASDSSQDRMFAVRPMDTWPPPGMRGVPFRNLERRWSVDHSLPEPLNLSSRDQSEAMGQHLGQMSPRNNPSHKSRDGRHSRFGVDTYR